MKSFISNMGRIIYAVPFIVFGLGHFMNAKMMAGMVPVPGGIIWVYVTGACLLSAGVSIIIQKKASLACLLLGILLLIFVFSIHLPNALSHDSALKMVGYANTLKDLGLAGAAFYMHGHLRD
jgi:uncharacterized membrane protein